MITTLRCDCLEALPLFKGFDSCVTDPPYHLQAMTKRFGKPNSKAAKGAAFNRYNKGFMAQKWDGGDISFRKETWEKVLATLKPGAFLIAFGGTRTYHRMTCAIEDAGFEIKDQIAWIYGQGFPKRNDALKPAMEPICVARKPLAEKSVPANVLRYGTGALNVNGCRVGAAGTGRWPANVVLDPEAGVMLDQQSGLSKSSGVINRWKDGAKPFGGGAGHEYKTVEGHKDFGGASRFFYCAKANSKERMLADGSRCPHPTMKPISLMEWLVKMVTPAGGRVLDPFAGSGTTLVACQKLGFDATGMELSEEYFRYIESRLIMPYAQPNVESQSPTAR